LFMLMLSAVVLTATPSRPAVDATTFRSVIMSAHRRERQQVGSAPLEWDEDLARDAKAWGDRLAATYRFEHCSTAGCPTSDQGENLWMGTRGAYSLDRMLVAWSREKRLLANLSSWEQDHHAVGHYTQMVWHSTRRIGCAVSMNRDDEFLVCRYMEPGNVLGESPFRPRTGIADAGPGLRPGETIRTDARGIPYIDAGIEDPADGAIDEKYSDGLSKPRSVPVRSRRGSVGRPSRH